MGTGIMDELSWKISRLNEVSSTNDIAKTLAFNGCEEGTVVLAQRQTSGRGRLSRKWISPEGGLWFSIILRPKMLLEDSNLLNVLAPVPICRVIRDKLGLNAAIKWPNDILIDGKKVCGILIENSIMSGKFEFSVIGVGINTNICPLSLPRELEDKATSLKYELNQEIDNDKFLESILSEIGLYYNIFRTGELDSLLNEWKELSCVLGQEIMAYSEGESLDGKALDIDDKGNLIIQINNGDIRRISSASIRIV